MHGKSRISTSANRWPKLQEKTMGKKLIKKKNEEGEKRHKECMRSNLRPPSLVRMSVCPFPQALPYFLIRAPLPRIGPCQGPCRASGQSQKDWQKRPTLSQRCVALRASGQPGPRSTPPRGSGTDIAAILRKDSTLIGQCIGDLHVLAAATPSPRALGRIRHSGPGWHAARTGLRRPSSTRVQGLRAHRCRQDRDRGGAARQPPVGLIANGCPGPGAPRGPHTACLGRGTAAGPGRGHSYSLLDKNKMEIFLPRHSLL